MASPSSCDNKLVYFCLKCAKKGIQHERFCKNCKQIGNGKVETYFKCPKCNHSMRYSNVWKHQKYSCYNNTSPSYPPISVDHDVVSEQNDSFLSEAQLNIEMVGRKRKDPPASSADIFQSTIDGINNAYRAATIDQLTNPAYGDYLYDLLEKEVVQPITGDPSKFYMNRVLNKNPDEIQDWIEEVLRKRPMVMEKIRNRIMRDLLFSGITTENTL